MQSITKDTLLPILTRMLNTPVTDANWQAQRLHGGDVGDVRLVSGTVTNADGDVLPFRLVHKTQRQWTRYADPNSWRREYDLYASPLGGTFTPALRWPTCYHAEISGEETQLWMEYIEAPTGDALTDDMLARAAHALGAWQGRLHAQRPTALDALDNLSGTNLLLDDFAMYAADTPPRQYIMAADCPLPPHLRQMFLHLHANLNAVRAALQALPVVLCHRDFWLANLFAAEGGTVAIDWDTAGWGYLGEDIAALIADDTPTDRLGALYALRVPAYYRGVAEHMDVSAIHNPLIHEMIVLRFGYRFVYAHMRATTDAARAAQVQALQAIYDMKIHD